MKSHYHFNFTKRKRLYFRIILTKNCNNNCLYCFREANIAKTGGRFTVSFFDELARVAKKYRIPKIHFTGGEPLLERRMVSFIERIKTVSDVDVGLTTNGTLLKTCIEQIYKVGLTKINVSVPTLDSKKYRLICGQDALPEVLKNIDRLISHNYRPIKINVPIFKQNINEIGDFLTYFLTKESIILRFFSILPNPGLGRNDRISNEEVVDALEKQVLALPAYLQKESTERVVYRPKSKLRLRICRDCPHKTICQDQAKAIRVTKDGKFSLCLLNPRYSFQVRCLDEVEKATKHLLTLYNQSIVGIQA